MRGGRLEWRLHCHSGHEFSIIPLDMKFHSNISNHIEFVEETRFGIWFLGTETWYVHVLKRALNDLQRMMHPARPFERILDAGCGRGRSIRLLTERFHPRSIVGLDPDLPLLERARNGLSDMEGDIELLHASATSIPLPDESVDMVFCHQTFHHIADQETAIREFYRVLKPGGVLLFAESTKRYIHSWLIRWLFRHPMETQKTADEYIALIRISGFELPPEKISLPFLWWSREDLGLLEKIGIKPPEKREETLVNAVATRPLRGA